MPNIPSKNIIAYALVKDLPNYSGPDLSALLPQELQVVSDFLPFIEQAGQIVLQSQQIPTFTPSKPTGLQSIFEHIVIQDQVSFTPKNLVFPFKSLGIDRESGFPLTTQNGDLSLIWADFSREFELLVQYTADNLDSFTETLVFLLKKYTSCIPLGVEGLFQSTKLFEYLKTRAAIAECLYRLHQENIKAEMPLVLLCADISGIQDFIYNIVRNKALRALKGRSFYLQQLLDTILQGMIDDPSINISMAHVLYNSGGKFYAIAPNIPSVIDALNDLNVKVTELMWENHRERLAVYIDMVPFNWTEQNGLQFLENEQLRSGSISKLWETLQGKTAKHKRTPLKGILEQNFSAFFEPLDEWMDENDKSAKRTMCSVTGELCSKDYRLNDHADETRETPIFVSPMVKEHAKLGYQMKRVEFYLIQNQEDDENQGIGRDLSARKAKLPEDLIREYYQKHAFYYLPSFRYHRIHYVNDPVNFLKADIIKEHRGNSAYGYAFYGGNTPAFVKDKNGDPLKFIGKNKKTVLGKFQEKDTEKLAGVGTEDDKHKGFKRLGILRMDVDGLGSLFRKSDFPTFAAYTTLSVSIDWFFSGYLNDLREKGQSKTGEKFADWINILYAGGDDLFLYGRWDICIEFAHQIRLDFAEYTCQRPGLSVSAGLALIEPKFPFNKGAKWAGEAVDASKNFPVNTTWGKDLAVQKNAFTLLGQTISWEEEFEVVRMLADDIYALRRSNALSTQFLYKLYEFQGMKEQGKWDWRWLSVYYFAKLRDAKRNEKLGTFIARLKSALFSESIEIQLDDNEEGKKLTYQELAPGRLLDLYILAAKWAELTLREKKLK